MPNVTTPGAAALALTHEFLLQDLRKLEDAVCPACGDGIAEVRDRLGWAHTHLTRHFRLEERNGYLDTVRRRDPRLERSIEQLAEDHRRLTRSLDALIGEAWVAPSLGNAFRGKVREWVRDVRRHEGRENELVQDAFNLDIGAED